MAIQRQQLPLVHQIRVTAQRGTRPDILGYAQPLMRRRQRRHLHFAVCLGTVQRRNLVERELPAPLRIHQDHQFGDDPVDWRSALALDDADPVVVDVEVVVRTRKSRIVFSPALFKPGRKPPQQQQFGAESAVHLPRRCPLLVELLLKGVVAKVCGNPDPFHRAAVTDDFQFGRHLHVHRQRRTIAALRKRVLIDHGFRQHGDLVSREVYGGKPLCRFGIERRSDRKAKRGRGDMNTDLPVAVRKPGHRERVIDLGGGRIVDTECRHFDGFQCAGIGGRQRPIEAGALGKVFEQEAAVVIVVAGWQRTAFFQQLRNRQPRLNGGLVQCLELDSVPVRPVQQFLQHRPELFRQFEPAKLLEVAGLLRRLFLLALDAGRLQRIRRCGLVTAFALLVEMRRGSVQPHQQPGAFLRLGLAPEVLRAQLLERELGLAAAFP